MAWTFSGTFLDGLAADRVLIGTGEPEPLPGRYALAGLVDAHAHPTVGRDELGPYLRDGAYGTTRLAEYAASGVTVIRDTGGFSEVTLGFARATAAGQPAVTAAGRFLAPRNRYFPRMHSPGAPGELTAAIAAEVAAGAAWVKIIGDFPEWGENGPVPSRPPRPTTSARCAPPSTRPTPPGHESRCIATSPIPGSSASAPTRSSTAWR
jgi:hypothetical protein